VVCPAFGAEAPDHGISNDGNILGTYTIIWNLLGMPAAVTPVTTVRPDEQKY
jgi:Asp-tRNA(Asn)/Glu-tRNA(Gln) amidotransferase A subunit family amidase